MSLVVVTGAAGFIGSHLARALDDLGHVVVGSDNMASDERWRNLRDAGISDFVEPSELPAQLASGRLQGVAAIFHQGANSDTTARDARSVLDLNFEHSVGLLQAAQAARIPFVYASSAAVYGNSFEQDALGRAEEPLNLYGYSKLLFDRFVRANVVGPDSSPVVGLRYFNVYGEREGHKGRMASVVHHFRAQAIADGEIRLFEGSGGYTDGEQRRDFVYVDDIVRINLFFGLEQPTTGIADVGTGVARSFNDMAKAIADHIPSKISYIPFPADLEGKYQHWTAADLRSLHALGFPTDHRFTQIEDGVPRVLEWLDRHDELG